MRVWTNQEGRTVKAALAEKAGASVVLLLENGARTSVAVSTLSKADQEWLQNQPDAPPKTSGSRPIAELKWPAEPVTVDPKSLKITLGKQDAAARQYHYQTDAFEFIATAPLAGSVIAEVASDFEVIRESFRRMPWGWEAKPPPGELFTIYLLETTADYLAMGGDDRSSATSSNGKTFIKFSALGLKPVGAKYQYDARRKEPGRVAGITARVVFRNAYARMAPWALNSLESSMRYVNYQSNGSIKFTSLESDLKKMVTRFESCAPSVTRMLKYLRDTWTTRDRADVTQFLLERSFDSQLLLYYFGYLDGDGSGAGIHRYFRGVFDEEARKGKTSEQRAAELLQELLAGRSDEQLKADMVAKFAGLGLKLGI